MRKENERLQWTNISIGRKAQESYREKTRACHWFESENDELNKEIVTLKIKLDKIKRKATEAQTPETKEDIPQKKEDDITPTVFQRVGRSQGRPRTCWRDHVSQLAWERLWVPPQELQEEAGDRKDWASFLKLLPPRSDPGLAADNGRKDRRVEGWTDRRVDGRMDGSFSRGSGHALSSWLSVMELVDNGGQALIVWCSPDSNFDIPVYLQRK
ncbi:uncharacterized protein LOC129378663 [Poeciliopsis prolifica]|uniref:uncharacterized protein LOC129378663 n=1 Tax=Poeciliopsis prolifica TaxID=188132 RepID=UPI00241429D2|nr:uncharacterized protein LOC129378663 [Poeciliopsis prolifica]